MTNSTSLQAALVIGALVAAACGGGGDVADEAPSGDEPQPQAETDAAVSQGSDEDAADPVDLERLTGLVMVTGTAQVESVTLQIDGGGSVNLSGVLRPELQRLSGAMVSVQGSRTGVSPREGFEVAEYEVTSIDGQQPSVGILEERDGGFTITGAETVPLTTPVPDALGRQVGAKVWVVGRQTGSGLQVQSYGVIREP